MTGIDCGGLHCGTPYCLGHCLNAKPSPPPTCRAGKTMFFLQITSTKDAKLNVYQKGSRYYSDRGHALVSKRNFERQGFKTELFETTTDWRVVEDEEGGQ